MPNNAKRLAILSPDEVQELFGLPSFSEEEREVYFSLDPDEALLFESLRQTSARLLFLIQLGYFKANHQFFIFSWEDIRADQEYLLKRYFPGEAPPDETPSKNTRLAQQKVILQCHNYRRFTQDGYRKLSEKARQLTRIHAQPRFLLTELLRILETERITVPGYSTFQKLIGAALTDEQKRLDAGFKQAVPKSIKDALNDLLTVEGAFYRLTALKKRAKDFSLKQIRQEMEKHASINPLYAFARGFLPTLDLSNENIRYYASLAEYYPVHRLQHMPQNQAHLYLLCFAAHCFEQISDNLIISFIHQVTTTAQQAHQIGQQQLAEYHFEHRQQWRQTGEIIQLFVDESIDDQRPFREIKQRAFDIIDEANIQQVVDYLTGKKLNRQQYEWSHIEQSARKIALNIRPLFMAIDFNSTLEDDPIINVSKELRALYGSGKSSIPVPLQAQINALIPSTLHPWITHPSHYEFFVYLQLKNSLEAGDIFYSGSTRYKSFDEDLMSKQELKTRQSLLASLDYPELNTSIAQRLSNLKLKLEQRFEEVNNHILKGKNPHLKFTQEKDQIHWTLPYKKQEDTVNNPFYEQLPQVGIISILQYVHEQCDVLESFQHIQPRYAKSQADRVHILACIIAYGERIGLSTMADISDLKAHLLRTTSKNFMSLENTRKANDRIANAMAKLPIFQQYNLDVGTLHASADGQKFEAQRAIFKTRYSKKYFGLNKGLVNYSLVVNHVPANAKLIGANEHESHYAFDIVFNNTSEIDPNVISVDMAGTNQVNFVLLETFGRTWAPRYTHIDRKATTLVGFNPISHYPSEFVIKPSRRVNEELILTEADNLQQIFASMALKTTSQSTIVRKLSSYARRNRTKKALWELDNIYMSLYVLEYIDDLTLRRNVQRALNRGEAYHQLQRAITHPNGGRFKGSTEHEIAIESDCSRLIANAIIYYNAQMLSKLWLRLESEGKEEERALVIRLSPVAWRHINLFGRYEFNGEFHMPDLDEIIRTIQLG
jgi:TnpA family transposase